MKINAFLIAFIFGLFTSNLSAEETLIQGKIDGFEGATIRVGFYEDYISFKKKFIASSQIEDGQFQLKIEVDEVTHLILMVEDKQTSLFAEAGQVYNLFLSYSIENNSRRAFEKFLDLRFTFPRENELNQKIKVFNSDYQDFFSTHYERFIVNEADQEVAAFIKDQTEKSVYQSPPYLKNYVKYALANLEDINRGDQNDLETKYLKQQTVLIKHKEYMNFFRQLYKEDFEQLLIRKSAKPLMEALMMDEDLNKSIQLIKSLKGFQNDALAELYLINGLFEVYHTKRINQKSNLKLLAALTANGSSEAIQKQAGMVLAQLKRMTESADAPAFSLKNTKGEVVDLAALKGKPVYLGFWANWSLISLKELRLMQALKEKYANSVHFISINIDEDASLNAKVKQDYGYDWPFLYGGKDYLLREQYEVRTVPLYYLIDKNGKLVQRYAPPPHQVENKLSSLID